MTAYQPFPRQTDTTQQTLFVLVMIAAVGYVAGCALAIFELNVSPDPLVGTSALVLVLVPVSLFVLVGLFISWIVVLGRAFSRAGRPGAVRRLPAYIAWRIGVIASVVLTIILTSRVTDLESYRRQETLYFAVRLAIGAMYVWCALSMRQAANTLPAGSPRMAQSGYPYPPTSGPTLPPPYYPPGHPLSAAPRSSATPPPAAWPPPTWSPPPAGPVPPPENPWAAPAADPTTDGQSRRDAR